MSNVLTPEAKHAVWRTYRARFILTASLVAILCALLSLLALLPTYLALYAGSAPAGDDSGNPADAADRTAITQTRSLLGILTPLTNSSTTPSSIVERALALRPPGVRVNRISYDAGDPSTLVISGTSLARDGVGAYRAALAKDQGFKSVSVPVSDLIGAQDGHFALTISGTF